MLHRPRDIYLDGKINVLHKSNQEAYGTNQIGCDYSGVTDILVLFYVFHLDGIIESQRAWNVYSCSMCVREKDSNLADTADDDDLVDLDDEAELSTCWQ